MAEVGVFELDEEERAWMFSGVAFVGAPPLADVERVELRDEVDVRAAAERVCDDVAAIELRFAGPVGRGVAASARVWARFAGCPGDAVGADKTLLGDVEEVVIAPSVTSTSSVSPAAVVRYSAVQASLSASACRLILSGAARTAYRAERDRRRRPPSDTTRSRLPAARSGWRPQCRP